MAEYAVQSSAANKVYGRLIQSAGFHMLSEHGGTTTPSELKSVCLGMGVNRQTFYQNLVRHTVTGNLDVHNNTAPTQVIGNTVTGNLTCHNNSSITGGPNLGSVNVQGQCYQTNRTG